MSHLLFIEAALSYVLPKVFIQCCGDAAGNITHISLLLILVLSLLLCVAVYGTALRLGGRYVKKTNCLLKKEVIYRMWIIC